MIQYLPQKIPGRATDHDFFRYPVLYGLNGQGCKLTKLQIGEWVESKCMIKSK